MIEITGNEMASLLPAKTPIVLDTSYKLISDERMQEKVDAFIRNRKMMSELKKLLNRLPKPSTAILMTTIRMYHDLPVPFEYKDDDNDCDNAALEMVTWINGNGEGGTLAMEPGHALVCFVNDQKEVKYINQYTGKMDSDHRKLILTVTT